MGKKHKGIFLELDYGKDIKLDLKDKKILTTLGENCRTPLSKIGEIANLSKDSVRYRIKELVKKDLYRGTLAILNPYILGVSLDALLLKLEKITPDKEDEIITFFENHPFIAWVGHTQGAYDYNVDLLSLNLRHLDKLIREIRSKLKGNLKDMKILHLTKMYSCKTIPNIFKKESKTEIGYDKLDSSFGSIIKDAYSSTEEEGVKLDKNDFLILNAIANKADMTLQEISKQTGIKPDTVKNRIINLIKKNVILAFRGSVNVSYLKFHGHILLIKLYPDITDEQRKKFENYFKYQDSTLFCTEASGSYYDFLFYLVAKDPMDFNRIINEIRKEFSEVIEEYEALLILKDFKFTFLPEGLISPLKKFLLKLPSFSFAPKIKTALFIGRFQPFHLGHLRDIKDISSNKVIIAIGSSQESETEDNPYGFEKRKEMIENTLKVENVSNYEIKNVPDIHDDEKWVDHVIDVVGKVDFVLTGNEKTKRLFEEKGYEVKKVNFLENVNGTKIRELLKNNEDWKHFVHEEVYKLIK